MRRDRSFLETIIDLEDLLKAQEVSGTWYAWWCKNTRSYYAVTHAPKGEKISTIYLHRWIMGTPSELRGDHRNHDTLLNTRENLRNVTIAVNNQNLGLSCANRSGARGVTWHKPSQKWRARIGLNNKDMHLGLFDDINQAAQVAHEARIKYMPGYVY